MTVFFSLGYRKEGHPREMARTNRPKGAAESAILAILLSGRPRRRSPPVADVDNNCTPPPSANEA